MCLIETLSPEFATILQNQNLTLLIVNHDFDTANSNLIQSDVMADVLDIDMPVDRVCQNLRRLRMDCVTNKKPKILFLKKPQELDMQIVFVSIKIHRIIEEVDSALIQAGDHGWMTAKARGLRITETFEIIQSEIQKQTDQLKNNIAIFCTDVIEELYKGGKENAILLQKSFGKILSGQYCDYTVEPIEDNRGKYLLEFVYDDWGPQPLIFELTAVNSKDFSLELIHTIPSDWFSNKLSMPAFKANAGEINRLNFAFHLYSLCNSPLPKN